MGPYDNRDSDSKITKIKSNFLGAKGSFKTDFTNVIIFHKKRTENIKIILFSGPWEEFQITHILHFFAYSIFKNHAFITI